MSTSATPSSFSSDVSTDSDAASCSITVSATLTPARLTHATRFCADEMAPVTMCTLTSSRAPVMPTGAPMPSCSSTTKSCGSTWRISRPVGSATAFAASIARLTSSRVISRFFPATATTPRLLNPLMCGPDSARCTESISMPAISSASSIAFLIESTAASTLTTTPRLMPRDSATPMPTTSSVPSSRLSPTTAVTREVPTSRPTRYRSLRGTLVLRLPAGSERTRPTLAAGSLRTRPTLRHRPLRLRPDVHTFVEAKIVVVDRGDPFAQRGREVEIRLEALGELLGADAHERGIALQDEDAVARVVDVDLGHAPREVGARLQRRQHAPGQRRARLVDERPVVARRRRKAVDDRQVELRVVRSELVDDAAAIVDEVQVVVDTADPHRLTLGDGDGDGAGQHPANRRVGDPRRAEKLPPPGLDVDRQHVAAADAVEQRDDFPFRQPRVAVHGDTRDRERLRIQHGARRQDADIQRQRDHHGRAAGFPPRQDPEARPARGRDVRAAEAAVGRRRYRHQRAAPRRFVSASTSCAGSEPIEPAPSVSTASPGRAMSRIAGITSSSRRATCTGRPEPARTAPASASRVTPAIGSSLAP